MLAAACAGRVRPIGPADGPPRDTTAVPAPVPEPVQGDTGVVVQPPAPPVQPRELEALPLPAGVAPDDFDISLEYNHRVEYWLQYFQRYHDAFALWLERMSRYEPLIRRELIGAGLPGDLIYLGLIESGFLPSATSSARAVGIWQFMAGTARLEGLEVSTYVDERRDPVRATQAAVHHLRGLYHELGSWYLVAAAYNSGSGRVARALDAEAGGARGADSLFWRIEPVLPSETRDYVPKFLAASILGKYPERFGIVPGPLPGPDDFDVVRIDRATDLAAIARAARTSEDAVRRLNPQYHLGVTPPNRRVTVRVPAGHARRLLARLAEMPRRERVHDLHYTADAGETPRAVAARYGVSLAALRKANHLTKKTKVFAVGRRLIIPLAPPKVVLADNAGKSEKAADERKLAAAGDAPPAARDSAPRDSTRGSGEGAELRSADAPARAQVHSPDADARTRSAGAPARPEPRAAARVVVYRVHEGDTLWRIARKHGVSVEELRDWNGLPADAVIRPGDDVRIQESSPR